MDDQAKKKRIGERWGKNQGAAKKRRSALGGGGGGWVGGRLCNKGGKAPQKNTLLSYQLKKDLS